MFRIEVFLQEMLEKVQKAEMLLDNESVRSVKTKVKDSHIIK